MSKERKLNFEQTDGGRGKYFKSDKNSPDCVVRAIAVALELPYIDVWTDLLDLAKTSGALPNQQETYIPYLESKGWVETKFRRHSVRLNNAVLYNDSNTICYINSHLNVLNKDTVFDNWDSRLNSMSKYPFVHRIYTKNDRPINHI